MLCESGLLRDLQVVAWANDERSLCLYGDPAYPLGIHLQAPFRNVPLTPQMERFNDHMSEVRVAVEWLFSNAENCFWFNNFKKDMKLFLSPAEKSTVFVLYCRIHILSFMEIK